MPEWLYCRIITLQIYPISQFALAYKVGFVVSFSVAVEKTAFSESVNFLSYKFLSVT